MGIIIAFAVIIAAVLFKLRYRPEGRTALYLFGMCVAAAVIMLLSVGSTTSTGMLFYAAELVVCALIVFAYRYEARRQAVARAARKQAAAARAAQERVMQASRKPLSCFAAFTESVGEAA